MSTVSELIFCVSLCTTGLLFLSHKWGATALLEAYFKKNLCVFCASFWISLICLIYETKIRYTFSYGFTLLTAALCCAVITAYLLPRIVLTHEKN